MARFLSLINGIPRTVIMSLSAEGLYHYDQSVLIDNPIGVSGTNYDSTHKIITLPSSKYYNANIDILQVRVNGVIQEEGYHFDYGVGESATTVTFYDALEQDARVRFQLDYSTVGSEMFYYREVIPVTTPIGVAGTGYNDAHTIFTLPNSQTYDSSSYELSVKKNGIYQVEGVDYSYEVGSSSTIVTFTEPVEENARIGFFMYWVEVGTSFTFYAKDVLVSTEIGVAGDGYNAAHTEVTLPDSMVYDASKLELKVFLNGVGQVHNGIDFNYEVGTSVNKVTFVNPIEKNARVSFYKVNV